MAHGIQVDQNRGRELKFLSWLRPESHVLTTKHAMIEIFYNK